MAIIDIRTNSRSDIVDITAKVAQVVPAGFNGICHLFCMHTTAGLTINENADPDVKRDIKSFLDKLVPWNEPMFQHMEGNSAAHLKASFMGFSQTIPVENGHLCLGTWQGVYFCEFDGPRTRRVRVDFLS